MDTRVWKYCFMRMS